MELYYFAYSVTVIFARILRSRPETAFAIGLVFLAAGGVVRSLRIALDLLLARAVPATHIPAPYRWFIS
jgi:uncharacterized integral membrane protein